MHLFIFRFLQLLQVFSYLACLGQQKRTQQVIPITTHLSAQISSLLLTLISDISSLFLLYMIQWKTILEWSLQVSVERGWKNPKEDSSLLPITQTNTLQTQSVFTSLKVNILLKHSSIKKKKKKSKAIYLFILSRSIPGVILRRKIPLSARRMIRYIASGCFRLLFFTLADDIWLISIDKQVKILPKWTWTALVF